MNKPQESLKNIWIACHLMYPHVEQAREVFNFLVNNNRIDQINFEKYLANLFFLLNKKQPIKCGFSYFEEFKINDISWKEAIDKCAISELFVLMCVLRFDLKYNQISNIISLHENKIKYLLNQAIRKLFPFPKFKFQHEIQTNFKKYNQREISLLFLNDNLIDYILGWSSDETSEKISIKIIDDLKFEDYKQKIFQVKNDLQVISINKDFHLFFDIITEKNSSTHLWKFDFFKKNSNLLALFLVSIIATVLVIRPQFLIIDSFEVKAQKFILSELILKKSEHKSDDEKNLKQIAKNEVEEDINNTKDEALPKNTEKIKENNQVSLTKETSQVTKVAIKEDVSKNENNYNNNFNPDYKKSLLKSENGVYRGQLKVKDLHLISSFLKKKLIELGSKKAGEVELGWSKNVNIKYFHFIFPADQLENLVSIIKNQGSFSYKYENHPRKLEPGQKRFIIEVTDK